MRAVLGHEERFALDWLVTYHALRHSFISILVAQGMTWEQIAAFVGHRDGKTTQRCIHFMPMDKRETANSTRFSVNHRVRRTGC